MKHMGPEGGTRGSCRVKGSREGVQRAWTAVGEGATLHNDRPGRNP